MAIVFLDSSLHVGEEVVDPSIVEDQTNGGGGGSDAEKRGENDDPPMPVSVTSPTALAFDLHATRTVQSN